MIIEQIENRITDVVFEFDQHQVSEWLNSIQLKTEITEDNELLIKNLYLGINCGLVWETSDYTTRGVMIAFAIAGGTWPHIFPTLLDKIDKRWRKSKKK